MELGPLIAALRAEVSGERALGAVRALARHHRIQATAGYADAAAWLCGELAASDLAPEVEMVAGDGRTRHLGILAPCGWSCARASAVLVDGAARERIADWSAEPLSVIQRSAAASGRFPVVDVGAGSEPADYAGRDVRGAVVLASGAPHRVLDLAVRERGAAGILAHGRRLFPPVRTATHDPEALSYTSFWWNGTTPEGWGFVVSPGRAARIAARLAAGARLELEVDIDASLHALDMPLVSAVLAPTGGGAPEALVLAHLCHPRPGANDNASGAAAALEAARALAALRARGAWAPRARAVRFLWVPEFTGSAAWFGRDPARAARTVAALNLDMVGEDQNACGSTFLLEHPPYGAASFGETLAARARRESQDWTTSYSGAGVVGPARMAEVPYGGGSDHAVLLDPAVGVPCAMLIQWPDRWYHTSLDTPDRCDPRSLAHAARTAAAWAGALAAADAADDAALARDVRLDAAARLAEAARAPAAERARRVAREAARAAAAVASLARLGVDPGVLERERAALAAARLVLLGAEPEEAPAAAAGAGARRVPVRRVNGPLEMLRHLLPGWSEQPRAAREAWHVAERDAEGGALGYDLAWFACDGARDLEAIAGAVWLECGHRLPARGSADPRSLEAFFERTAALGLSTWQEAVP
uniref:DUF4910 domain-containing protein n=1 Tax=Eiseniibacteriota bacterium TaxID=2212470 RepID=A0A832MKU0_UNCEI